jgi:site-specific recombinase XerD
MTLKLNNSSGISKPRSRSLSITLRPQNTTKGVSLYFSISYAGKGNERPFTGIGCKTSEVKKDKNGVWQFVGDEKTKIILSNYEHNLWNAYHDLVLAGQVIDLKRIAQSMKGKPVIEEIPAFFMAMDIYVQATWFDTGTHFEEITKLKNKRFFNHIKQWAIGYFGRDVIGLNEIKPAHANEIIKFMISARGAGNNHANMHVQRLKGFFQYAIGMDWIEKNPFLNFKSKHEKVKIKHLTLQDIHNLETLQVNESTVYDVARDLFLFCCYTGLSYADLKNVETKHIKTDTDGFKYLEIGRMKTDELAIIPLRKKAVELIEKYYFESNNKLFQVPTNQQLNRLLKELGSMANLSILPTWHIARKTCATLLISDGLEVALVQRILGHANMSTTLNHYGKINERPILDSFKKLYQNQ